MSSEPFESKGASVLPLRTNRLGNGGQSSGTRPVVGVGASAGGLEAFTQLLAHLPADTGMVFLLVQHLDPRQESHLANILAKVTVMPVLEATNGLLVQPNHVYVIPPNSIMVFAHGVLHLTPRSEGSGLHLPVDALFRSLAEDQQQRAIGVVLSGTGADGTIGLCEIKAVGGITFAQDEDSAKYPGMPHSAIENLCVDFVLTPEAVAMRLAEIGARPYLVTGLPVADHEEESTDEHFRKILAVVRSVTGVDFSQYRDTTIRRRIMRRTALYAHASLPDYLRRLHEDRAEVEALYGDLLITVTSFFRDPTVFEALKDTVFPALAAAKSAKESYASGCLAAPRARSRTRWPWRSWSSSTTSRSAPQSRSSPLTSAIRHRWRKPAWGSTPRASRPKFHPNDYAVFSSRKTRCTGSTSRSASYACSLVRT